MTFNVQMKLDNIFLNSAKLALENMDESSVFDKEDNKNLLYGSNVIISCLSCLEGFINNLFICKTNIKAYDQLRLEGKIETLYNIKLLEVDWGKNPYQTFKELISIRNWLIHYKESYIGFLGSENDWIKHNYRNIPSNNKNPIRIFTKENCKKYYEQTKQIILDLAQLFRLEECEYNFALKEEFEYFIIG